MNHRLQFVHDWQVLAKESGYKPRELAALCQISLRTLERHFQKHYGLTVAQWLKELRLQEAYEQIKQGSSVKEVAFDMGYKQLSHFSREFKNEFGVSPSMLLSAMASKARFGPRQESPTSPQMVFTF
jgi:AraC-like DNA-binding protein